MKILLINNFFHIIGGAEVHFFDLAKLLKQKGHEVIFFSMASPKNFPSKFSKYFVSYFPPLDEISFLRKVSLLPRALYSFEARWKIRQLILDYHPDIVHIHNIWYEITHSIIHEIKSFKIPIVMTLHDYRLICPNHKLLTENDICFRCNARKYYHAVLHGCLGSFSKNLFIATFGYLNNVILKTNKLIDLFISPSSFLIAKMEENILFKECSFIHLPNFYEMKTSAAGSLGCKNSILYFGRIDFEKGIDTLIDAVRGLNVQLKIIGSGLQEHHYRQMIKNEQIKNIECIGFLPHDKIKQEISQSLFAVLPSRWYENFPHSIVESFAQGKPVIGASRGGIAELIKDGETGLTFKPGNVEDLRNKIKYLLDNPEKQREFGLNAQNYVIDKLNPKRFYSLLMQCYKGLLDN